MLFSDLPLYDKGSIGYLIDQASSHFIEFTFFDQFLQDRFFEGYSVVFFHANNQLSILRKFVYNFRVFLDDLIEQFTSLRIWLFAASFFLKEG